jgi:hypothetical protein
MPKTTTSSRELTSAEISNSKTNVMFSNTSTLTPIDETNDPFDPPVLALKHLNEDLKMYHGDILAKADS